MGDFADKEKQESIKRCRRNIEEMLARPIPKSYSDWSYDRARAYKEAVNGANKAMKSARSTYEMLLGALGKLRGFYES